MNEPLTPAKHQVQDDFTAELNASVTRILDLSDDELDGLLAGEDRTFADQVTPAGAPLTETQPADLDVVAA